LIICAFKKKLHYPEWNQANIIPEIIDETEEDLTELNYNNLIKILELDSPRRKSNDTDEVSGQPVDKGNLQCSWVSESAAKMRLKRAKARVLYLYKEKFAD
jgi:hypothetical protein